MVSTKIEERQRWLSGVPTGVARPWWQRMLRSPLFWLTAVLVPFFVYCLWAQYQMLHPDDFYNECGAVIGLNNESLKVSAYWAMWSALAWSAVFVWLDRFRLQRPLVWLLTFGWGACVATWFSLHANSWIGEAMSTLPCNADMGSRPAVFAAPFVEEVAKATVLFLLVVLWRARIVSRLSIVSLAGLSAVGFAFVENIIYYARVYVYAMNDISVTDPAKEIMTLVRMRGIWTSFAHPLFTTFTALGLAIALGSRSKIVRVVAPVAGFCLAAAGHMMFNGMASTMTEQQTKPAFYYALGLVALLVALMVVSVVAELRLIRRRVADYRLGGWLSPRDPEVFGRAWPRFKLHLAAILRGPRMWWRTARFMRRMTELAYVREATTRGTVGEGGDLRAHELIHEIEAARPTALTDTEGLTIFPPRRPRRRTPDAPPPVAPGPAGLGGNWGAR